MCQTPPPNCAAIARTRANAGLYSDARHQVGPQCARPSYLILPRRSRLRADWRARLIPLRRASRIPQHPDEPGSPDVGDETRRFRKCAGINRHVVGNERVLQERR